MKRVIAGFAVSLLSLLSAVSVHASTGASEASTGASEEEMRMKRVGCIVEKYYERRRELKEVELQQAAIVQDLKASQEDRRDAAMQSMVYFEKIKDLDAKFNERFALVVKLPVGSPQHPEAVEHLSKIFPGIAYACPMYFQN